MGSGAATICGGDSYGIRLLNCQYVEVRNLHLAGSGVTPRGESTNKAIGLDIYSTATTGKPWQSIHVDRVTVKGFREGIVFHTRARRPGRPSPFVRPLPRQRHRVLQARTDQGVVGYNDVQITNCEVGECLFSGIYGWGSAKSSGKPWFLPVGNGTFTNCRIADCLVHDIYCDPVGDPWLGTPIQLLNATGCTIERCTIRHCGQAANPKGSQGGIGGLVFLECRQLRGPVQRVPPHGDHHRLRRLRLRHRRRLHQLLPPVQLLARQRGLRVPVGTVRGVAASRATFCSRTPSQRLVDWKAANRLVIMLRLAARIVSERNGYEKYRLRRCMTAVRRIAGEILMGRLRVTFWGFGLIVALEHVAMAQAGEPPLCLTPPPRAQLRINGPTVFGVRPGSPFLYGIPASGERPIEFSVGQLPEGLTVDSATGRICGTLKKAGVYKVVLRAKNARGSACKPFRIIVGEQDLPDTAAGLEQLELLGSRRRPGQGAAVRPGRWSSRA